MPPATGEVSYVKREIFFFEKTHLDDVYEGDPTFFSVINSKLVGTTKSDARGYFQIELPEGEYSAFVKESDKYYANRLDRQGYIFPVKVEKGNRIEITFIISYKATG